jgi:hypothetical protein
MRDLTTYDFETRFAAILGLRPETLRRYIRLEIVVPDAITSTDRYLFLSSVASVERHRVSIRAYRLKTVSGRRSVKELHHV